MHELCVIENLDNFENMKSLVFSVHLETESLLISMTSAISHEIHLVTGLSALKQSKYQRLVCFATNIL